MYTRVSCHTCVTSHHFSNTMGKDKSEKKKKKRKAEEMATAPPTEDVEVQDASPVGFLCIDMCATSYPRPAKEESKKRKGRNRHSP